MSRIFTIVEGLENLGAIKTGGQGSVYKGRRQASIYTAIKLLPTPIHTESADDKNFRSFQSEVEKLYKVNEQASPYVVKILSSGLTESGSFPYIEMEYIEGPDLCELLQAPHPGIFSIREVIKVAEQLASALAHCHRVGIQHGDIKDNNVRYNTRSGNYVLLDFGLALMNEEQRRTSLRHAGAIEFMAPEQNEGLMLPQTDIYSFGVVLYELLAGRVPFVLTDRSETARTTVMLQHMEAALPDLTALRYENLPAGRADRQWEAEVPDWLLAVIHKCLNKRPADRYADGIALQEAVNQGSLTVAPLSSQGAAANHDVRLLNTAAAADVPVLQSENDRLLMLVDQYRQEKLEQDKKLNAMHTLLLRAGGTFNSVKGVFELKSSILHVSGYVAGLFVAAMLVFAAALFRMGERRHLPAPVSYHITYRNALRTALPGIVPYVTDSSQSAAKRAAQARAAARYRHSLYADDPAYDSRNASSAAGKGKKRKRIHIFGITF